MSFLKSIKPNKPTANLEGYFIAMLSKSKFGKTTFAIDLANKFYGNLDSTLLLAPEVGYKATNGVYAVPITDFNSVNDQDESYIEAGREDKGFIQVVNELIENKNEIPFRFIIIDTITALERYATSYCIKKANKDDKPQKRYKDISDIPWGKGYNMIAEEIYSQIDRLKKAGFGVFIIGHEKVKGITTKDDFKYDYITFNVQGKTSDIIEREADMIIYGDQRIVEGGKGSAKTERKLIFRSDGNILCGTRFRNFPSEIDNDVDVFIEEFKKAILDLYEGDEDAVKVASKEQKEALEKLSTTDDISIVDIKDEIKSFIEKFDKPKKVKCAKEFKVIFDGDADYTKSEDVAGLKEALQFVKSL